MLLSLVCFLRQVDVYFILAKGYLSHELGMLGFPAYDRNQLLLGFYKEVQSQAGQTQVRSAVVLGCTKRAFEIMPMDPALQP